MKGIISSSNIYLKIILQGNNTGASIFEYKMASNFLELK